MKLIKNLICMIFGCDWKYNFPSQPNKCICNNCDSKAVYNFNIDEWESVLEFKNDTRTNEELKKKWIRIKH